MPMLVEIPVRVLVFVIGAALVVRTLLSAVRTFILPRSARDPVSALYFGVWRRVFYWRANRVHTYEERDQIMAMFAPLSLILIPAYWLTLIGAGYTLVYWALGVDSFYTSFVHSGSTLTTLGYDRLDGTHFMVATFSESAISLILVAILISYLPTMYSAFSRRETAVTLLEVRAGTPPSAVEILGRAQRVHGLQSLTDLFRQWEQWFAELEESHTSLAALVFFRSPDPQHSWVTAAGTVLDCAALYASTVDAPPNPQVDLCIQAGYLSLQAIADFYRLRYDSDRAPGDTISVTRQEFDEACARLTGFGVPLRADREQCWCDFVGWRANYDTVVIRLAAMTMAPYAAWISDRSVPKLKDVTRHE